MQTHKESKVMVVSSATDETGEVEVVRVETHADGAPAVAALKAKTRRKNRSSYYYIIFLCLVFGTLVVFVVNVGLPWSSGSNSALQNQDTTVAVETPTTNIPPTIPPSQEPSHIPSMLPSQAPTTPFPTTASPTTPAPTTPAPTPPPPTISTFFAIGDVPYSDQEASDLERQIRRLDRQRTADFLIHVGDIRAETTGVHCEISDYRSVASILSRSPVPVLLLPGDNEWQDCTNTNRAIQWWYDTFWAFEQQHWNSTLRLIRMNEYPESFYFLLHGTLYIGLNIVGGLTMHDPGEWYERLNTQVQWVVELMRAHVTTTVIFGHANPNENHAPFFGPLTSFLEDDFPPDIPVLYLNGDQHRWMFTKTFFAVPNWTRITLTGGTSEPPLWVQVDSSRSLQDGDAFVYDRMLD